MTTTFKFLNENDNAESEEFSEIRKESSMKGQSKEHIRKGVTDYFNSKRVVDEWNKVCAETVMQTV